MELVKQLNLNKTPQNVPNGSFVFAKNIKLSKDSAFITQEEGIESVLGYETDGYEGIEGEVKGVIPCVNELIVFSYKAGNNPVSLIYRCKEIDDSNKLEVHQVTHDWVYANGDRIIGTYTYNVNGDLIITFSEVGSNTDIPLRTGKFVYNNGAYSIDFHDISPNLPISNIKLNKLIVGVNIPRGIYHFFIRYELDKNQFSNWFPIGIPYYAINLQQKTLFNDYYNLDISDYNMNTSFNFPILRINRNVNNLEFDSAYTFNFEIKHNNVSNEITSYQLGYILQTEDGAVGRIAGKYKIESTSTYFTFRPNPKDEEDINEFIENPFSLYNVKHICNYDNRLYIADYKETDYNEDLRDFLSSNAITITKTNINYVDNIVSVATPSSSNVIILSVYSNSVSVTNSSGATRVRIGDNSNVMDLLDNNIEWSPNSQNTNIEDVLFVVNNNGTPSVNDPTYGRYMYIAVDPNDNTKVVFTDGQATAGTEDGTFYKIVDGYFYLQPTLGAGGTVTSYAGRIPVSALKISSNTVPAQPSGSSATDLSVVDNSVRCFMPGEYYNFYVHYVRKDGSYTNGLLINSTPYSIGINTFNSRSEFKGNGVEFGNVKIPAGFVGVFFSYEKTDPTSVYTANCVKLLGNNGKIALFKATEVECAKIGYNAITYMSLYKTNSKGVFSSGPVDTVPLEVKTQIIMSNSIANVVDNNNNSFEVNLTGQEGGIIAISNGRAFQLNEVGLFKVDQTSISDNFKKETKDLIKLGGVLYGDNNTVYTYNKTTTNSDFNYPAFMLIDQHLIYDKKVYIAEDGQAYEIDNNNKISTTAIKPTSNNQFAHAISYFKFSLININAVSIKREPENVSGVITETKYGVNAIEAGTKVIGTVVRPLNATDLLELRSEYIVNNFKLYTNFTENNQVSNLKTGTIRRSQPIRDESTENSWTIFKANQYKEIDKNKGRITNIIGIGDIFLIHTEHTIFILDRNSLLKTEDKNVQLVTPDTFDVEPKELLTSANGYGGLQTIDSWTINQNGYWWYDSDSKKLYNFDNGKFNDFTNDIVRFINNKDNNIIDCKFVSDNINNRIIICFEMMNLIEGEDRRKFATISFNYYAGKFISLHDYQFTDAWNTKTRCYLFSKYVVAESKRYIYGFSKDINNIGIYAGLGLLGTTYNLETLPSSYNEITRQEYSPSISDYVNMTRIVASAYIDVIFNGSYEIIKSLESIHYILNIIEKYDGAQNDDRMAEEDLNNIIDSDKYHYSGEIIQIYTDATNTGLLDIYSTDVVNKFNNYKYPYFDLGRWNLNYFRNRINIEQDASKRISDKLSLIIGKYIVIRFIFNKKTSIGTYNVKPIKFENVWITANVY